jgi:hypothetical protein
MKASSKSYESQRVTDISYDYSFGRRPELYKHYRRGHTPTWSVDDVQWERGIDLNGLAPLRDEIPRVPKFHPGNGWDREQWQQYEIENIRYMLSQTLHGENFGFIAGVSIAESAPDWDVKICAVTQAADEARHAECFSRYLDDLGGLYEVNKHMDDMVREILQDTQWDRRYLIAQVFVEAMGLGTFGFILDTIKDPLLVSIVRYAIADEARHVAFGVQTFGAVIKELTDPEVKERQDIALECTKMLIDRLTPIAVAQKYDIDERLYTKALLLSPSRRAFEARVFSHVGPICSRLGLMERNDGYLRAGLESLGVLDIPEAVAAAAVLDGASGF